MATYTVPNLSTHVQVYDMPRLVLALWDRFGLEAIEVSQLPDVPEEQVKFYDVTREGPALAFLLLEQFMGNFPGRIPLIH